MTMLLRHMIVGICPGHPVYPESLMGMWELDECMHEVHRQYIDCVRAWVAYVQHYTITIGLPVLCLDHP